jgi:hypothetical protein
MRFAIKLGPVETGEGRITVYAALGEADVMPPVLARRDLDGLRQLAEQAPGEELCCEPALAEAGRTLGFTAGPLPEGARQARALLATVLALGGLVGRARDPEAILALVLASAAFWRARPWRHWYNIQALDVEVSGALTRRFEGSILGNGGEEYGVALYERKGALRRVAALVAEGRMEEATHLAALGVTMDERPRYAVKALKDAFGLPRVPVPMKIRRGDPGPVDARELAVLATALHAVAALTRAKLETTSEAVLGGTRTVVRVRAPEPEA